jgi:methionyl-tRNA formyltransferase
VLPRRRPADGRIDWSQPAASVYDFIRALTRPYPGAFSRLDGARWTIWQAARLPLADPRGGASRPGEVLGPMVSPLPEACGQVVACGESGTGAVVLLEAEAEDGTVLSGPSLAEQPWTGKVWTDGDD